jgi:hypothetical protein
MAIAFAVNNGNWSDTNTWSGSYIPQPGDDVYSNNKIVDVDVSFEVATLRSTSGTGITAGGSFRFLSGSISGSVTDSSPLVPGATNLIQVTAVSGTVELSLGGSVTPRSASSDTLINHSGACNFNLSGSNFNGLQTSAATGTNCINKTSAGLITITGNLNGGAAGGGGVGNNRALLSTNGNTVIIGNIVGGINFLSNNKAIDQSTGTLTITGNVTGGQGSPTNQGITFSGTQLIINGNITGGIVAVAVDSSSPVNIINGTVTGGSVAAISSTTANQINISGSVIASANAVGVSSTNASGIVILNGNITNNAGKQAIYCQNLFLSDTGTTQAQFFTSGSQDRTLYSANTFPNLPSSSIVRSTTLYGPGNELSGSLIMPDPANVRYGVPTDNTTGSALLSAETLFNEIATSTNPVAVRLRKSSTTDTFGYMLTAFKK